MGLRPEPFGALAYHYDTRRLVFLKSTDLVDLFYAHIGGMDIFARALLAAHDILENSEYPGLRRARYASFDQGDGQAFENGKLTMEDLHRLAHENGELPLRSGRQELFENIVNRHL